MEPRTMSLLLLLLVPLSVAAIHNDETALLAFKAAAGSGGSDDPLAQWNGSRGGYCSWEGVRCRGRHQRVVAISLPSQGLTGVLSPAIGNLSSLRFLNLSSNKLTGDIPETVGRLHRLRVIDLSYNGFYGELPANISSCTSLKVMDLHHNQLYGCVPYELGSKRTPLELLDLSFNNLTGAIPTSLSNFSSLIILSLAFNKFEGTVPDGIGANLGLRFLGLAFNNLSEYGEGSSVSSAGDVYSLGILLLEMFTGRSPTNDMFRGSWDLHKFCEDALPRRILDIVDTTLWLHTVIRDNTMRSTIENCLLSVISLGISCSQKQPKERTPIQDAAIEMHAIRDLYLKSAASVVQEHSEIATESADL
nr:unnamed protein product [Digitaria exilis]